MNDRKPLTSVSIQHTLLIRQLMRIKFSLLVVISFPFLCATGQVLDYTTEIRMESGKHITEKTVLIQINNRDMEWLTDVSIFYQEGDNTEVLEANVLNMEGKVLRAVSKKEIKTRNYRSGGVFFEDSWVDEFKLKWHQFPYRIQYRYRITTNKYIYLCRWYPYIENTPIRRATLRVTYPKDLAVTLYRPPGLKEDSVTLKGKVIRSWEFLNIPKLQEEKLSPAFFDLIPCIIVAPKMFTYGIPGKLDSWASFGMWQAELNANSDDLPDLERYKITDLLKGGTNRIDTIKRLYHYLQDNTRYINVSLDVGGLKAFPASYVSANKYGDCKALTIFMKSILNFAGIPSYYTKINGARNPRTVRPQIPGQQFNHIILCVPMGRDTVWLENTANSLPYNYLGTFTQGRPALVVNGEHSRLVRTPALTLDQVYCRKEFNFHLDMEGTNRATASWELRGDEFETLKDHQQNSQEQDVRSVIESSLPRNGLSLTRWEIQQPTRDTPVLHVKLNLELTDPVRRLGKSLVVKSLPFPTIDLEDPGQRTTPVRINYPINEEQILTYHLPTLTNYAVTLPRNIERRSTYGSYVVRYTHEGQTLRAERHLIVHPGTIPLVQYNEFFAFMGSIQESNRESSFLLEPKP